MIFANLSVEAFRKLPARCAAIR